MSEKSVSELLLHATMLGTNDGTFSVYTRPGQTIITIGATQCYSGSRDLKTCLLSALYLYELDQKDLHGKN